MSIFDRLISTLKGGEEAVSPAATQAQTSATEEGGPRRFMGRDGAKVAESAPVKVEEGLKGPALLWLHVQPSTQRLLIVPDLGVAEGTELTGKMMQDLRRAGLCEEVAYHAGYDQYWKMPSQEAILRTPSLYEIPTPLMHRIKLETRLVKQGEARGFWMRVQIRADSELPAESEAAL